MTCLAWAPATPGRATAAYPRALNPSPAMAACTSRSGFFSDFRATVRDQMLQKGILCRLATAGPRTLVWAARAATLAKGSRATPAAAEGGRRSTVATRWAPAPCTAALIPL